MHAVLYNHFSIAIFISIKTKLIGVAFTRFIQGTMEIHPWVCLNYWDWIKEFMKSKWFHTQQCVLLQPVDTSRWNWRKTCIHKDIYFAPSFNQNQFQLSGALWLSEIQNWSFAVVYIISSAKETKLLGFLLIYRQNSVLWKSTLIHNCNIRILRKKPLESIFGILKYVRLFQNEDS